MYGEENKIEEKSEISAIKFSEGGAAILAIDKKNHIKVIIGNIACMPLVKNNLRVWVASYKELAMAKRPEELKPCAIIIMRAPSNPQYEDDTAPAVISPIWPIEEYAIKAFKSVWRRQMNLVTTAPHNVKAEIKGIKEKFV